ncbi:MAG TPA: hypothetical protein VFJ85_15180 [Acidimicrobiales bacterium]|nr:hypothetical protein [Acidimicrobiales bacterium]
MLYAFGFERVAVVACDLYFEDPDPEPDQPGPEQGVRLELRSLERGALRGSIYSAQPIAVERPLWRADLLESVDRPGSLDRAHHHPRFAGWEPGRRHFDDDLTADPVAWVGRRLGDVGALLAEAGVPDALGPDDAADLAAAVPEIVAAVERLLGRVRAAGYGDPGRRPPAGPDGARVGWL